MPQRFLKPGLITSRKWENCSWLAQSFYVRVLTLVDDFGRYDAEPVLLKSQSFPIREDIKTSQIEKLCQELKNNDLAIFYQVNGKPYLQLTNWTERSRSNHSKFPDPPQSCAPLRNPAESCLLSLSHRSSSSSSPAGEQKRDDSRSTVDSEQVKTEAKPDLTDGEWLESLKQNTAYQGIEVQREYGKMLAWCEANKRQPTRRRFVNWLNRCERPMGKTNTAPINPNAPKQSDVQAYADEKGGNDAKVYAVSWYRFWNEKQWKRKDGSTIDWQVEFQQAWNKHRGRE